MQLPISRTDPFSAQIAEDFGISLQQVLAIVAVEQAKERKAYHKRCDEPPPKGLSGCGLLRWLLQREEDCVSIREAYVKKWKGTYPGHQDQIEARKRAIDRLKKKIQSACPDPPCPAGK